MLQEHDRNKDMSIAALPTIDLTLMQAQMDMVKHMPPKSLSERAIMTTSADFRAPVNPVNKVGVTMAEAIIAQTGYRVIHRLLLWHPHRHQQRRLPPQQQMVLQPSERYPDSFMILRKKSILRSLPTIPLVASIRSVSRASEKRRRQRFVQDRFHVVVEVNQRQSTNVDISMIACPGSNTISNWSSVPKDYDSLQALGLVSTGS